ncbi:hypothetical protein Q1695_016065 [Nippostrongylus brasiliensis]|nr:hypothetical protein Q1695_016065 [Nippostrongylus brasiliensis]
MLTEKNPVGAALDHVDSIESGDVLLTLQNISYHLSRLKPTNNQTSKMHTPELLLVVIFILIKYSLLIFCYKNRVTSRKIKQSTASKGEEEPPKRRTPKGGRERSHIQKKDTTGESPKPTNTASDQKFVMGETPPSSKGCDADGERSPKVRSFLWWSKKKKSKVMDLDQTQKDYSVLKPAPATQPTPTSDKDK